VFPGCCSDSPVRLSQRVSYREVEKANLRPEVTERSSCQFVLFEVMGNRMEGGFFGQQSLESDMTEQKIVSGSSTKDRHNPRVW
jgi:hypothetical protein